jgi:hypothetical protein
MYLLQALIVFAVVASNIHWQWTPNPHLAAPLITDPFPNVFEEPLKNLQT